MSIKCVSCPQPVHPSTGDYDAKWDMWRCETCYKRFLQWMKGHVARAWSGHMFYVVAATSVKPGDREPNAFHSYRRVQGPMQQVKRKHRKPNPDVVQVVPVTNEPENVAMVSELWVSF